MELRKKGVTRHLLWEEYCQRVPVRAYSYSQFCYCYQAWCQLQKRSMRQQHIAGEKCFIDYCGPTITVISPETGECRQAQIFVAVLGASNYTFAEATWTQSLQDWLLSHVRMLEFFGGVPEILVPDNLNSAVNKACRYDPELNPSYQQLAEHYQVAVIPARPRKPRDKPKAEVGVQIVERWFLARLRHQVFFSLSELNHCIRTLVASLNAHPFKKIPGNRREAFARLDQAALRPLPVHPWRYLHIKKAKVNIDYHVESEQHYYFVQVSFHLRDTAGDLFGTTAEVHPAELVQLRLQIVYFAFTGGQFFQQGLVQRFLFGKALFQLKDVVRRGVVHKPVFYQAYTATTRIKRTTAWSGMSAAF